MSLRSIEKDVKKFLDFSWLKKGSIKADNDDDNACMITVTLRYLSQSTRQQSLTMCYFLVVLLRVYSASSWITLFFFISFFRNKQHLQLNHGSSKLHCKNKSNNGNEGRFFGHVRNAAKQASSSALRYFLFSLDDVKSLGNSVMLCSYLSNVMTASSRL